MTARVHFTSPSISSGVKKYTLGGKTSRLLYKLAGGGNPFTPILDLYSGATMGFSLLQISSAYTGDCIKVRRSSDNTEAFIAFKNGALDTVALLAFCGSGDGYVTIWYDQSGNGKHATQVTALNQPQIVDSGAVIIEGDKPTLNFASSFLNVPATLIDGISTVYHIVKKFNNGTFIGSFAGATTTNLWFVHAQDIIFYRNNGIPTGDIRTGQSNNFNLMIQSAVSRAVNPNIAVNGAIKPLTFIELTINNTLSRIGFSTLYNGRLSECVIWSGQELNLTELSDDVNTNYNAY